MPLSAIKCNPYILFFLWILIPQALHPQNTTLLRNAYSHNDYWHRRPLLDALDNGFAYVEADIYPRKGKLVVAHLLPSLRPSRTLDKLYLDPLKHFFKDDSTGSVHPKITLMIDIKSDPEKTCQLLISLLQQYRHLLSRSEKGILELRAITIVLTGNRPLQTIRHLDARYVFMDEDLTHMETGNPSTNLYPIASCHYRDIVRRHREETIAPQEKERLCAYVQLAHEQGKKVRLWASPENAIVWRELLDCGVDLINTDKLVRLRNFLLNEDPGLANVSQRP